MRVSLLQHCFQIVIFGRVKHMVLVALIGCWCCSAITLASEESDQSLLEELRAARERIKEETQATSQAVLGAEQGQQNLWVSESAKALLEAARKLAERSAQQERPLTQVVEIPAAASVLLEEFLVANAELHNERARIENELRQAPPEATAQALLEWEARERSRFGQLREWALQLAAENARQPISLPAAPNLTPAHDPAFREFVAAQQALAAESAVQENRNITLSAAERDQATLALQAQRSARMRALAEQALALANKDLNVKDDQIDRRIHE